MQKLAKFAKGAKEQSKVHTNSANALEANVIGRFESLGLKPTLSHLARLSGTSTTTVSNTLSRKGNPSSTTLTKIMRGLNLYEIEIGLRKAPLPQEANTVISIAPFQAPPEFSPAEASVVAHLKQTKAEIESLVESCNLGGLHVNSAFLNTLETHMRGISQLCDELRRLKTE